MDRISRYRFWISFSVFVSCVFSDYISTKSFSNGNCSSSSYTQSAATGDLGYGECQQGTSGYYTKFTCINSTAMNQYSFISKDCSGVPVDIRRVTNEFGCKVYASIPNQSTRTTCETGSFLPASLSYVTFAFRDTTYSIKSNCVDIESKHPNPSSISEWKLESCIVPGGYSEKYSCYEKNTIKRRRYKNKDCSGIEDESDITVGCTNTSSQALLIVCTDASPSLLPSPLPSVTPSTTPTMSMLTSPSQGTSGDFIQVSRVSYNVAIAVPTCLLIIICAALIAVLHKQRIINIPILENRKVKKLGSTTAIPNHLTKDPMDWGLLLTSVQTRSTNSPKFAQRNYPHHSLTSPVATPSLL